MINKAFNRKDGITLIALVVTIVVLLILASVTINMAINHTGLFSRAAESNFKTQLSSLNQDIQLYVNNKQIDYTGNYDLSKLSANDSAVTYNGTVQTGETIKDILKSATDKNIKDFSIANGELKYIGTDENESKWFSESKYSSSVKLASVTSSDETSGTASLSNASEGNIENYQIYGQSVQLPSEYRQVEYLESTGTQYIDTGFTFEKTDEMYAKVAMMEGLNLADKYFISPVTWNTDYNRFALGGFHTDGFGTGYFTLAYGSTSTGNTQYTPATKTNNLVHTYEYKNYSFSMTDLGLTKDVSNIAFGSATTNLRLFYGYNAPTSCKIYYYKHKKNNILVCNMIPCVRLSDTVAGMYDTVNKVFYTNAGTGTFNIGTNAYSSSNMPVYSLGESDNKINLTNTTGTNTSTATIDLTGYEPLRKVGDAADYIDYASGKIVRNVGKITFNGSENWKWTNYNNQRAIYLANSIITNLYKSYTPLCNCLQCYSYNEMMADTSKNGCYPNNTELTPGTGIGAISISNTGITSVETGKSWLASQYSSGTPVTVYYQLITPTYENISLPQIKTFSGTNILTATSGAINASKVIATYLQNN